MKYALVLFLCFSTSMALAQREHPTYFGFKGGLNRSVINGHEPNGTSTGFIGLELYASLFADSRLGERWRIENEILFSFTDDYYFIEIPLHIKYQVFNKTFIFAGPKLDIIVNPDDEMYNFNNFGVSVEIGAQYEFAKRFFAEIRYSQGLFKQINDYALDIYDGKRNTLRLGLGIRF